MPSDRPASGVIDLPSSGAGRTPRSPDRERSQRSASPPAGQLHGTTTELQRLGCRHQDSSPRRFSPQIRCPETGSSSDSPSRLRDPATSTLRHQYSRNQPVTSRRSQRSALPLTWVFNAGQRQAPQDQIAGLLVQVQSGEQTRRSAADWLRRERSGPPYLSHTFPVGLCSGDRFLDSEGATCRSRNPELGGARDDDRTRSGRPGYGQACRRLAPAEAFPPSPIVRSSSCGARP